MAALGLHRSGPPGHPQGPRLWKVYQRLQADKTKKPSVAKVAVARRLLALAYRVLGRAASIL